MTTGLTDKNIAKEYEYGKQSALFSTRRRPQDTG
jgi:hypothetical protein